MRLSLLALRNCFRHPLWVILTALGVAIALISFCLIQTVIHAWFAGVRASAKDRLVVRNAVSLVVPLPIAYLERVKSIPGVRTVGYANWFGGIYKDESFRFPQFAIDENYLDIYSDFILPPAERQAFHDDRRGAVVGKETAEKYGIKIGDVLQMRGTIYPGMWEFTVRGIYSGRDDKVLTRALFFHWEYLNERNRVEIQKNPDSVGVYIVQLRSGANPAAVSNAIDSVFANSYAETKSESETAFQQSFVSMSSSIIVAMQAISFVVVIIMALILCNTMVMSTRERLREYAILKAVGFRAIHLFKLLYSEALIIACIGMALAGAVMAAIFSIPPRILLGDLLSFFPVFELNPSSLLWCAAATLIIGALAAAIPTWIVVRMPVVEGLRE